MKYINPICKMIGILIPAIILAFVHNPILNFTVFIICIILITLSHVPLKRLFLLLLPILLIATGMYFTGYHFSFQAGAPVNAESLSMTDSRFWNGLIMSSRVFAYAGLGFLFVLTTDKILFVLSIQQQLHVPPIFTYGLMAAWNIFPDIVEEYHKTRIAFRLRGLHPSPVSPVLLKPMLVKAVLWSEGLSVAMESKGFNGRKSRTDFYEIKIMKKDILFPVITTCGLLLIWFLIDIVFN